MTRAVIFEHLTAVHRKTRPFRAVLVLRDEFGNEGVTVFGRYLAPGNPHSKRFVGEYAL